MSDEYDCDFAGDDDAMMMIRAAVRYLLQGATGGAHGDFVQRSFRSCASSRTSSTWPAESLGRWFARRLTGGSRARCPQDLPKNGFYKSFNLLDNSGLNPELSTCVLPGLVQRLRLPSSSDWFWFWLAPLRGPRPSAKQASGRLHAR
jgi:hypothetical protein